MTEQAPDAVRGPTASKVGGKNPNKKSSNNGSGGGGGNRFSLTNAMVVVIAVCCIASAVVNVIHVHTTMKLPDMSEHHLLKDFAMKKTARAPLSAKEVTVGKQPNTPEDPSTSGGATGNDPKSWTMGKLSCSAYGGPADEYAQEMVYWKDIPSDSKYVSPFHLRQDQEHREKQGNQQRRQYMTFEPDGGGWNNIRMAMETVLGLAIAMGRTLVMPPEQRMYLLSKNRGREKTDFSFADFFPMHELARENDGLKIISTKEFLEAEAMTGNLRDKTTGKVSFPPKNWTDWNGKDVKPLKEWLRNVTYTPLWGPGQCLAAFPASGDHKDLENLRKMQKQIHEQGSLKNPVLENPTPVDATPIERMRENMARRKELCVYDEKMQKERVVHFMCYHKLRVRMLVHFYAFLYFEDWREDLWMKRFMRDHVRYVDEIQCAAARIVHAMREYAKGKDAVHNPNGDFDTFHVRRGDFQFKDTRIDAKDIYENVRDVLPDGSVVYIATDERQKSFFNDLKKHYDVKFMDDFQHLLKGVNTNYYGMIDQLVASRGRKFFGCWHSTFTGFINRIRGYHSVNDKTPGYKDGLLYNSYYYVTNENKYAMHNYTALSGAFFNREFPTSWRDIDKSIGELPNLN